MTQVACDTFSEHSSEPRNFFKSTNGLALSKRWSILGAYRICTQENLPICYALPFTFVIRSFPNFLKKFAASNFASENFYTTPSPQSIKKRKWRYYDDGHVSNRNTFLWNKYNGLRIYIYIYLFIKTHNK